MSLAPAFDTRTAAERDRPTQADFERACAHLDAPELDEALRQLFNSLSKMEFRFLVRELEVLDQGGEVDDLRLPFTLAHRTAAERLRHAQEALEHRYCPHSTPAELKLHFARRDEKHDADDAPEESGIFFLPPAPEQAA
jgi:hypothetical protein